MADRPPVSLVEVAPDGSTHEPVLKFNDVDLSHMFAATYKGRLLFDHTRQDWRIWDEKRWVLTERLEAHELVKEMLYGLRDASPSKEVLKKIESAMSYSKIKAILQTAASLPFMSALHDEFDADPYLVNLQNGTYDLRLDEMRPHSPLDRLTMVAGASYDPKATCPRWDAVIKQSLGGDESLIDYFYRALGYAMTGLTIEKRFWIIQGKGDSGKTTVMNAVRGVLGDYFRIADWSTFAAGKNDNEQRHRTDLVALVGGRVVSASEGGQGVKLSEGMIKAITGRSSMSIRELNRKPFTIRPNWHIFLDTNHLPPLRASDSAMWARVVLLLFRHSVPVEEQLRFRAEHGDLEILLHAERDGIFNRLLYGWESYNQLGRLAEPQSVLTATAEYRKREDTFGEFLEEMCEYGDELRISKGLLHGSYLAWAKKRAEYDMSAKKFGENMIERGFDEYRTGGIRYWVGVQIRASSIDPDPPSTQPF